MWHRGTQEPVRQMQKDVLGSLITVYVCVLVCAHVYVLCECMWCMSVCVCAPLCMCVYECVCVCICMYVCVCARAYECVQMCVCGM